MIASVELEKDLFFAREHEEGGWTYTLASQLGQILRTAQERFGPRDQSYTILGVEFADSGPQIWYPSDYRDIVIQISPNCATDWERAYFQLAHEVIHLLSPSGKEETTVFEEGLATYFSICYMREYFNSTWGPEIESYKGASDLLEQLLAIEANAVKLIRKKQQTMYKLTRVDIQAACPGVGEELANELCSPFKR